MNVIQLIQAACGRIGIPRPNSASGSSDTQVIQLLGLLNDEGSDLSGRYPWQALMQEASFTTLATEVQGSLTTIVGSANGFSYVVNDTIWNRSRRIPVYGPRGPGIWQGYKAFTFAGPYSEYRIRGGNILFQPAPAAGDSCYFEYITKNWATDATGVTQKSQVSADDDVFLLDDSLLLAGLKWRFKHAKGLEYGEDFRTYQGNVLDAIARDGSRRTINLGGGPYQAMDIPLGIPRTIGS